MPRSHIETITTGGDPDCDRENGGQQKREIKLGAWVSNQRSRAVALTPERVEQLSAIGMRWT
ncbi:helicase associated domain-containing protein [Streptomyces collinus]|uniref:helicase associated domain-containing protein n=1 Tax=Streptomyces collinus TaxID=42684 RepID=UPI0036D146BA